MSGIAANVTGAPARRRPWVGVAAGGVWVAAVVLGTALLWSYAGTPGAAAAPPLHWIESGTLPRPTGRPTLVVVLHPLCPCSRATLGEVEQLLGRHPGKLDAYAVFVSPDGLESEPEAGELWAAASRITGLKAVRDAAGAGSIGRRLGAETSGQSFVYDAAGHLRFGGGLTAGRGHAGANAGVDAVAAILTGRPVATDRTPVFGCPLW